MFDPLRCLDGCNFADITFKVDNESIAAHKVILSARCPYFATMLEGKWNDRNSVRLKNDTVRRDLRTFTCKYSVLGQGRELATFLTNPWI